MQGRIACANVLSDLYAFGVVNCDNMLMLLGMSFLSINGFWFCAYVLFLGISEGMQKIEQDVTTTQMIQGFNGMLLLFSTISIVKLV